MYNINSEAGNVPLVQYKLKMVIFDFKVELQNIKKIMIWRNKA